MIDSRRQKFKTCITAPPQPPHFCDLLPTTVLGFLKSSTTTSTPQLHGNRCTYIGLNATLPYKDISIQSPERVTHLQDLEFTDYPLRLGNVTKYSRHFETSGSHLESLDLDRRKVYNEWVNESDRNWVTADRQTDTISCSLQLTVLRCALSILQVQLSREAGQGLVHGTTWFISNDIFQLNENIFQAVKAISTRELVKVSVPIDYVEKGIKLSQISSNIGF